MVQSKSEYQPRFNREFVATEQSTISHISGLVEAMGAKYAFYVESF